MSELRWREPQRWSQRPCLGTDLHLWYGPGDGEPGETPGEQRWREQIAKRVCVGCPVIDSCLANELLRPLGEQWGVRGGVTAAERQELIRRRSRERPAS